jgi:hypothetical protein
VAQCGNQFFRIYDSTKQLIGGANEWKALGSPALQTRVKEPCKVLEKCPNGTPVSKCESAQAPPS